MGEDTTSILRCGICPQLGRPVCIRCAAADEIVRLRAASAALYLLLDEMHRCGRRQPGLTEALEGWEAVIAATKEDDRG